MTIHSPFIITARLLPGIKIGNDFISIAYDGETCDGRTRYRYYIDIGDKEFTGNDLMSGALGGTLQDGVDSLLSFLIAAASESYRSKSHTGKSADLFPPAVISWAHQNSSDLECAQHAIIEMENLKVK